MSGLMDKVKDKVGGQMDKQAQPGDNVERKADSGINDKIDNIANQAGVSQGDDKFLNDAADKKINSDIPGGN